MRLPTSPLNPFLLISLTCSRHSDTIIVEVIAAFKGTWTYTLEYRLVVDAPVFLGTGSMELLRGVSNFDLSMTLLGFFAWSVLFE